MYGWEFLLPESVSSLAREAEGWTGVERRDPVFPGILSPHLL
jgi:hypothetical protein